MRRKQAVFVDTVGWIALLHRRDDLNKQTVGVYRYHYFEQAGFEKLL